MISIHTTDELGISLGKQNSWIAIPETEEEVDWIMENPNILHQIYHSLNKNDPYDIN